MGDIDGKGEVYRVTSDHGSEGRSVSISGSAVLSPDERLISFHRDMRLEVWADRGSKDRFYRGLCPTSDGMLIRFYPWAGWGTMYVTDRRILFLRKPDIIQLLEICGTSRRHRIDEYVPGVLKWRAERLARNNGLEYVEIPIEDITGYRTGRRSAVIRFKAFKEEERLMRLPVKALEGIRGMLDQRGIREIGWLSPGRGMFMLAGGAALVGLSLLKWFLDSDGTYLAAAIALIVVFLVLAILSHGYRPMVENVKLRTWNDGRGKRMGRWTLLWAASVLTAAGVMAGLAAEEPGALVLALIFGGVLMIVSAALGLDKEKATQLRGSLSPRHRCPSCGAGLSRSEISCPSCGAVIWWYPLGDTPGVADAR